MSHALSVESTIESFRKSRRNFSGPGFPGLPRFPRPQGHTADVPTPMDISNLRMKDYDIRRNLEAARMQDLQWRKDRETGACFSCHKIGCRFDICPLRFPRRYQRNADSDKARLNVANLEGTPVQNDNSQGKDPSQ